MKDRIPLYPGRVKLTAVDGQPGVYDMVRADEATEQGTPLSKATLLADDTASLYGLTGDAATVNKALKMLGKGVDDIAGVGDVRYSFRSSLGSHWALCNGALYSAADYPKLAEVYNRDYASAASWPDSMTALEPYQSSSYYYSHPAVCPIGFWRAWIGKETTPLIHFAYSKNGVTWTEGTPITAENSSYVGCAYVNGRYAIYAYHNSTPTGEYFWWTEDIEHPAWVQIKTTIYTNQSVPLYGSGGLYYLYKTGISTDVVYYSSDMITWKQHPTSISNRSGLPYPIAMSDGSLFCIHSSDSGSRSDSIYIYRGAEAYEYLSLTSTCIIHGMVENDNKQVAIYYENNNKGTYACCLYDLTTKTKTYPGWQVNSQRIYPYLYYDGYYIDLTAARMIRWSEVDASDIETITFNKTYTATKALPDPSGFPTLLYYDGSVAVCATRLPVIDTGVYKLNAFIKVEDND